MEKELFVTKASGETVPFSEKKLRRSLHRAGATEAEIDSIITEMSTRFYQGIPTKRIYKHAFSLLKGNARHLAAKYHLKQAIMELGPSGYSFEKYIGEILRHQGYSVKVGVIQQGKCVQHEVDVVAEIDHRQLMIECKYHNQPGIFCDVKVPLYINSRFKDVEAEWIKADGDKIKRYQGGVVTNTRFSSDAIQYGMCAGLKLIGWDYPEKGGLKDQIDALGLYPVTCLTSLTKTEKQWLLDRKVVLCLELRNNETLLHHAGIRQSRINTVLMEVEQICEHINITNVPTI